MELTSDALKRRSLTVYETNPFTKPIETTRKPIFNKSKDMALVHGITGEITDLGGFISYKEVSKEKFCQLFLSGVRQLTELSSAGVRAFAILYQELQTNIGKDLIYMSFASVDQTTNKMGLTTYNRGMQELRTKGFIAPSVRQGWFWINPNYIYNGDRMRFVQEFRVAPTPQPKSVSND